MNAKKTIIIGAGPAGLTAAFELLKKGGGKPLIFEAESYVGGISRTYSYKGCKMDMGGHRFFSKSDAVMDWWLKIMPLQGKPSKDDLLLGRKIPLSSAPGAPDPESCDLAMLIRSRLSRIYFLRSFFKYPVALGLDTVLGLGPIRIFKIGLSYLWSMAFPRKTERTLEDFMVNRFGKELYLTFFKDYTEKVWGVPCEQIPADWGAQRIKGVSIAKILKQALLSPFMGKASSIKQKEAETSLIEQFLYPKFGPGQFWEEVARRVVEMGGEIHLNSKVSGIEVKEGKIISIEAQEANGEKEVHIADNFISSMPVRDLIKAIGSAAPPNAGELARGLKYRDFRTVGLLVRKLKIKNRTQQKTVGGIVPDTWIYIQERDVKLGRLQIFNNWSPYLIEDLENTVWLGLEYFCDEGDWIWEMDDGKMTKFAAAELAKIGIIDEADVLDSCSVKVPKAYPGYFGTYSRFDEIREFLDTLENLYPVGRNGMHRYNNMDHSMLTAIAAVDSILNEGKGKTSIWDINAKQEYHESRKSQSRAT